MCVVAKEEEAEPTNEAINAGGLCTCILPVLLKTAAMTANPQNAPTNDQAAPTTFPTSCFSSFLYPKNLETDVGNRYSGDAGTIRLTYRSTSKFHLSDRHIILDMPR